MMMADAEEWQEKFPRGTENALRTRVLQSPKRMLRKDFSRPRCAGNASDMDAESVRSSATGETEDDVWRLPVHPGAEASFFNSLVSA